jgi:hypothetical protein
MNPFAQEWRFERYPVSSGTRHLLRFLWGRSKRATEPGLRITARLEPSRSTCDFKPALIEDDSLAEGPITNEKRAGYGLTGTFNGLKFLVQCHLVTNPNLDEYIGGIA